MAEEKIDMKRYDRQIRLWGLDTQTGLQGARVLLLRVTGLCNEIAKNLVLAGVGHVCIQDPGFVQPEDIQTGAVFYFNKADLGRPRADVMAERLRTLNPSVDIGARSEDIRDLGADGLKQYTYIIGTHGAGAVRCSHPVSHPTAQLSHEACAPGCRPRCLHRLARAIDERRGAAEQEGSRQRQGRRGTSATRQDGWQRSRCRASDATSVGGDAEHDCSRYAGLVRLLPA